MRALVIGLSKYCFACGGISANLVLNLGVFDPGKEISREISEKFLMTFFSHSLIRSKKFYHLQLNSWQIFSHFFKTDRFRSYFLCKIG